VYALGSIGFCMRKERCSMRKVIAQRVHGKGDVPGETYQEGWCARRWVDGLTSEASRCQECNVKHLPVAQVGEVFELWL